MGYTLPDGTTIQWGLSSGRRGISSADVYDTAQYNLASYDGGSVISFTAVTEERIHSFSVKSGKDKFGRRFKASSLTVVVDNRDGFFTLPDSLLQPGDYVKLVSIIQPPAGLPAAPIPDGTMWLDPVGNTWTSHGNLVADDDNPGVPVLYFMWYGRVDSATDIVLGGVDVTRVVMYDIFAELASIDKDAQVSQGAGETSFQRMNRIGDNATEAFGGFVASATPASATMQATTLAQNALAEMQLTMESEGGDVWADRGPSGTDKSRMQMRGRDWLTTDTRSTVVQYKLGGGELPLLNARLSRDQQLVVNDATISNAGGVAQNVTDIASNRRYGTRTFRRLDLLADTDAQALFLAQRFVANLKDIRPRVREATVDVVDADTALFAANVAFGDLIQTMFSSIHGWNFTTQAHVIGIGMEVSDQQWRVVLNLDDAFVDNIDGDYDYQAFSEAFSLGGQP